MYYPKPAATDQWILSGKRFSLIDRAENNSGTIVVASYKHCKILQCTSNVITYITAPHKILYKRVLTAVIDTNFSSKIFSSTNFSVTEILQIFVTNYQQLSFWYFTRLGAIWHYCLTDCPDLVYDFWLYHLYVYLIKPVKTVSVCTKIIY